MLHRIGSGWAAPVVTLIVAALAASACSGAAVGSPPASTAPSTSASQPARGGDITAPTVAADPSATGIPAFYTPPAGSKSSPPGTLIRAEVLTGVPGVPPGATLWRILYHSRTIYGADLVESGYVVTPAGHAPAHGWPIISWAHGTTGFGRLCAPSLFTSQAGMSVYLIPGLADFLRAGFAIAATDYQGLGAPGVHGYLLGESEGRAVLDAARAAQQLPRLRSGTRLHLSNTVIIYGHSQGGQAALFAGELAPSYAPDLRVIGVAAAAPATNLSTIMSYGLSPAGNPILDYVMAAAWTWTQIYHDLPVSDLFTSAGARAAAQIVTTGCQGSEVAAINAMHLTTASVFRPGAASNPAVVAHVKFNDPGHVKTLAPMLVVQGTADTTVPQALTDTYVQHSACRIGDRIDYVHVTGASHGTVVVLSVPTIVKWMSARLRGSPAPTTCGRPGAFSTISP